MFVNLLILIVITSLSTWALTDIYLYSVLFEPIREYGERVIKNTEGHKKNRLVYLFLYALNCPFCISHWFAAVSVIALWLDFRCLKTAAGEDITPITMLILIPIAARIAGTIQDWVLIPVTNTVLEKTIPRNQNEEDTQVISKTRGNIATDDSSSGTSCDESIPF
jgi:hypothetical protein